MKKNYFYLAVILIFSSLFAQEKPNIVINEILTSNKSGMKNPSTNSYDDWFELYNSGDDAVNLMGFYLSDDLNKKDKWQISSNITIQAKGFYGFWADDLDYSNHTNFKLAQSFEQLVFSSPQQGIIDSVSYAEQYVDISFGRYPDGSAEFFYFLKPSPGKINDSTRYTSIAEAPQCDFESGFYGQSIIVKLSAPDSLKIHYSLDGSIPTQDHPQFSEYIYISETTVLRARCFSDNSLPSRIISRSFFINERKSLPVFSFVTDPANFFDDYTGIYIEGKNGITGLCSTTPKNWNQEWERTAHLDFFESDKTLKLSGEYGISVTGGCSRIYPQKSLAIFARSKFGPESINYKFFNEVEVDEFKSVILRNSAQDWWRTMFRDGMIQSLLHERMDIDYQAFRPSIVYLNGEYWGIHNIREKLNKYYLTNHYGVKEGEIDIIELSKSLRVNEGSADAYNDLIDFVTNNDLKIIENYQIVADIMDINEYIDYNSAQIFCANADWPGNNVKVWRSHLPGGKFRWMIFDLDFGFGGNSNSLYNSNTLELATSVNGPAWPNPPWSTLLLRKLLENNSFKNDFVQRFAVHANTTFSKDRIFNVIDSIKSIIADEIPAHKERWVKSISFTPTWEDGINLMRDFTLKRWTSVKQHFINKFGLSGTEYLTLANSAPGAGELLIYGVKVTESRVELELFKDVPVKIKSVPKPGYLFDGWFGVESNSPEIEIYLTEKKTITARYKLDKAAANSVIINEINYNSAPEADSEDWLELLNISGADINLNQWLFKDTSSTNAFIIDRNYVLKGDSLVVLARDTSAFKAVHSGVTNLIGNFDFGISNAGETIFIYNHTYGTNSDMSLALIDSVNFDDLSPWPVDADGTGATLALKEPSLSNDDPNNWFASPNYGTPGRKNNFTTDVSIDENIITYFRLYQNYPNPFNPSTVIKFQVPSLLNCKSSIFLAQRFKHWLMNTNPRVFMKFNLMLLHLQAVCIFTNLLPVIPFRQRSYCC
ncbi:MAG: CotH kinase family protein [Bacteroidetes bacterium]|nr:CotH kinase family protein [Bacteroidota bacterium]